MIFDPDTTRSQLLEFEIEFCKRSTYGDALQRNAVTGLGVAHLECSVRCLLVGFFDVGKELALKSRLFLRAAVEMSEPNRIGESHRFQQLSLANWIVDGQHDAVNLKNAVRCRERWMNSHGKDRYEVQHALPTYLDAEESQALISRFEGCGLTEPTTPRRIQAEGTMAYAITRKRMGVAYQDDDLDQALKVFLKRHVPNWLGKQGRYTDAAQWMKIAFWKPGDDPIQTILRCYDFLPGLEPPAYP